RVSAHPHATPASDGAHPPQVALAQHHVSESACDVEVAMTQYVFGDTPILLFHLYRHLSGVARTLQDLVKRIGQAAHGVFKARALRQLLHLLWMQAMAGGNEQVI